MKHAIQPGQQSHWVFGWPNVVSSRNRVTVHIRKTGGSFAWDCPNIPRLLAPHHVNWHWQRFEFSGSHRSKAVLGTEQWEQRRIA